MKPAFHVKRGGLGRFRPGPVVLPIGVALLSAVCGCASTSALAPRGTAPAAMAVGDTAGKEEAQTPPGLTKGRLLWGSYWSEDDRSASELFPLFDYMNYGPIDSKAAGRYGVDFTCMLLWRHKYQSFVRPVKDGAVNTYLCEWGLWPIWNYSCKSTPDRGARETRGSLLLILCESRCSRQPAADGQGSERRSSWRILRIPYLDRSLIGCELQPDGGVGLELLFIQLVK